MTSPTTSPSERQRGRQVVVIGAGPIGASTARWLTEGGHQVTIVGPDEPEDHSTLTGPWSGHYDQGRLAAIDAMFVPTVLGLRSMRRYDDLQARSGIDFTSPLPLLTLFPDGEESSFEDVSTASWRNREALMANAADFGGHAELLDQESMAQRFSQLKAPAGQVGVFQDDAVLVNPRSFAHAERTLAQSAGAAWCQEEAVAIEASSTAQWQVRTRSGETLDADRVVVAVGAYTNASTLLEPHTSAPVASEVLGCTIVLLEVPEPDGVDFPGYMYMDDHYGGGLITPPRRYPDGSYYLKCASGELMEHPLTSLEEITDWVRMGGSDSEVDWYREYVARVLPDVRVGKGMIKPCLPSFNASGLPYIDRVADGIVLATEGERGVMMGDEIGRLAAGLAGEDRWVDPVPSHLFATQWVSA